MSVWLPISHVEYVCKCLSTGLAHSLLNSSWCFAGRHCTGVRYPHDPPHWTRLSQDPVPVFLAGWSCSQSYWAPLQTLLLALDVVSLPADFPLLFILLTVDGTGRLKMHLDISLGVTLGLFELSGGMVLLSSFFFFLKMRITGTFIAGHKVPRRQCVHFSRLVVKQYSYLCSWISLFWGKMCLRLLWCLREEELMWLLLPWSVTSISCSNLSNCINVTFNWVADLSPWLGLCVYATWPRLISSP